MAKNHDISPSLVRSIGLDLVFVKDLQQASFFLPRAGSLVTSNAGDTCLAGTGTLITHTARTARTGGNADALRLELGFITDVGQRQSGKALCGVAGKAVELIHDRFGKAPPGQQGHLLADELLFIEPVAQAFWVVAGSRPRAASK